MAVKTWGFRTRRELPAASGNPKVCVRCDHWFLAGPRERACFDCLTNGERARRAVARGSESDSKGLENRTVAATPLALIGLKLTQVSDPGGCPWTRAYRRTHYPELAAIHN